MDYFINFTIAWSILVVVALVLISLRSDSRIIADDIDRCFENRPFFIYIGNFLMIWAVLPLSIPYSLANLIGRKK
jgi:hypothetical protein